MNETFEEKLLKEHRPEPLEGHTVVVFERVGEAGEKFHGLLPPGAPMPKEGFLRTMLGPKKQYFAYAVTAAPERHMDFSRHVVSADHAHEFDLLFDLCYYVDDPRLLASTRADDPLGTVRRKVGDVIAAQVAELPWTSVWHTFRASADTVVHDNLHLLRTDAARCGIGIRSIGLGLQLPETETETIRTVERGIADLQLRRELTRAELEDEEIVAVRRKEKDARIRVHALSTDLQTADLEEQALEALHRRGRQTSLYGAERDALGTIGKNVTNLAEFRNAFRSPRGLIGDAGAGHAPALISPGGAGTPARLAPGGSLAGVVNDLVAATREVHPPTQRNALRSALLHLVAEVLADGAGDEGRRDQYAQRAHALADRLHPRPGEDELKLLMDLMDPACLRRALDV
jgi:hypothetical protein